MSSKSPVNHCIPRFEQNWLYINDSNNESWLSVALRFRGDSKIVFTRMTEQVFSRKSVYAYIVDGKLVDRSSMDMAFLADKLFRQGKEVYVFTGEFREKVDIAFHSG